MSAFRASEGWQVRLGCGTKYSHHVLPSQLSNVVKHIIYLTTTCNFSFSLKLGLNGIILMADWAISWVWSLDCRSISFGLSLSTGCNSSEAAALGQIHVWGKLRNNRREHLNREREKKKEVIAWMCARQKREDRERDEWVLLGIKSHSYICIILDGSEYSWLRNTQKSTVQ